MNNNNKSSNFQQDRRLENLDPERLSQLLVFAKELSDAPQDQKLNTLLSISKQASEKNISFSADERTLLMKVLTEHLSPEEKKRVEMIRIFSSRFSANKT